MAIPVEAKSFTYTPECFDGIEGSPTFVLRYGTRRDRHTYQDELRMKNLRHHDADDFQAAIKDELRAKWASDEMPIDDVIDAVERYFTAVDGHNEALKEWNQTVLNILSAVPEDKRDDPEARPELPPSPEFDFDPVERERVENLVADVETHSMRIGRMNRDNGRREREIRRVALAIILESTSLPVALHKTIDGVRTDEALFTLEEALEKEAARLGVANPIEAFTQLGYKALFSFFLEKDEEKNSESPPPTTSDQSGSITSQETDTPLLSQTKASAKSPATPETSSLNPTAE
jgi:hypothetical protein